MADISVELAKILSAVYGEDVRGSIHDAIEKINDVSEVVLSTGTAVTSATSSSTGFYEDSLYLNTNTYELWKCTGTDTWASQGVLKGADGNPGPAGDDGNLWYIGTSISGKAVLPTVYSGSGITDAHVNDCYLNTTEGAVYHCTLGGAASVATWVYDFTMSGGGGGGSYSAGDGINISAGNAISVNTAFTSAGSRANITTGDPLATIWGKIAKFFTDLADLAFIAKDGPSSTKYLQGDGTWQSFPSIPSPANNGQLTIQKNGTNVQTFTADQSANATANIQVGEFIAQGSPNNGSVSFTVDDTAYSGLHGYDVYIDVISSSTNKSPYAKLSSISGEGTSSMTLTFDTDADNGTNTAHLYLIK